MEKTRFFTDFSDCGLFCGFSGLDMTLRDSPAVFRILDKEDFYVSFVFRETKNNPASGRFADDFLDSRLFLEDGFTKLCNRGGFVLFRKGFRNF